MGHSYSEEQESRINATFERMTVPQQAGLPLREMLIAHITSLVTSHNERTNARMNYLRTGDTSYSDLGFLPQHGSLSPSRLQQVLHQMEQSLIEMPALDGVSDQMLLAHYNALLLKLREQLLPDPYPA